MGHDTNHLGQPVGRELIGWKPPIHPPHTILQGQYCRLEPLHADRHAEELYTANSLDVEGRNWTYLLSGPFTSLRDYRTWIDQTCGGQDPLFYAIMDPTTDRAIGAAAFLRIAPAAGSIEVGHLNYSPLLQRTRAATEAMYLMMRHAFELGYRRYEWKCDSLNGPSRAAAQRLGLSFEGVFRQATVVRGRNRDTAWYATIDAEWPLLQAAFDRWLDPSNFDQQGRQKVRLADWTGPVLKARG